MKYIMLVSHGMFAPGLHDALKMLAGSDREDILSTSLKNGIGTDEFAESVRKCISVINEEDELVLFADLVGGSPLTTAANVIAEEGLISRTTMIGGMNLPMVLSAVLMKDNFDREQLKEMVLSEAKEGLKEFTVSTDETEDEI